MDCHWLLACPSPAWPPVRVRLHRFQAQAPSLRPQPGSSAKFIGGNVTAGGGMVIAIAIGNDAPGHVGEAGQPRRIADSDANSPANISPVGRPPAITTACSVIVTLRPSPRRRSARPRATRASTTTRASRDPLGSGFGRRFYWMTRVLKQAPCWPHIRVEGVGSVFRYFRDGGKLRG